jgi:threonine synthase
VELDAETLATIQDGFASVTISDAKTSETIKDTFEKCAGYLLDPHTAVAVAAANTLKDSLSEHTKTICLATAHPAKFPEITRACLETGSELPDQGKHASLERASKVCQQLRICDLENLEFALVGAMTTHSEVPSN